MPQTTLSNLASVPILYSSLVHRFIHGHFNCRSSNVIYLIRCPHCPDAWYIDETMNAVHIRMNGHRNSIQHPANNGVVPVGDLLSRPGRSQIDMIVSILVGAFSN